MIRRLCITLIFVLGLVGIPRLVSAATLSLSPSGGTIYVGRTLTVRVIVNSNGQAINATQGTLNFPTDRLSLNSVSKSGSVFSLWPTEPSGSNASGKIVFSGGLPNPGYSGNGGTVMVASFTATTTGTATITLSGSKILANDGQGTNILTSQGSATYTLTTAPVTPPTPNSPAPIVTPQLGSTTHPDSAAWYKDLAIHLTFTHPSGLDGISYGITDVPDSVPDESADPAGESLDLRLPGEGVWYIHLRGHFSSGWSATAHFKVQIDQTAPEPFTITVQRDRGDEDATPILEWSTTDAHSAVTYTVKRSGQDATDATSPLAISLTQSGQQTIEITAMDQAGNTRTSTSTFTFNGYPPPIITSYPHQIILLDSLVIKGTAALGDLITLSLNDREIGQAVAGPSGTIAPSGTIVRVPWTFTTDQVFAPGIYRLTATAKGTTGLTSAPTDPVSIRISGARVAIGGRAFLTLGVVPVVALIIILLLALNAFILVSAAWSLRRMHQREVAASEGLEALEQRLLVQRPSTGQIESALEQIERELVGRRTNRPRRRRRNTR